MTTAVEASNSLRVGHLTFFSSILDSRRNRPAIPKYLLTDIPSDTFLSADFFGTLLIGFGKSSFSRIGSSLPFWVCFPLEGELFFLVLTANAVAYPIAYYAISTWLKDFPYRISINFYTFIISTVLALMISLATVAYQSIKAASANPIETLRYEWKNMRCRPTKIKVYFAFYLI